MVNKIRLVGVMLVGLVQIRAQDDHRRWCLIARESTTNEVTKFLEDFLEFLHFFAKIKQQTEFRGEFE